ncbi:partner and localizer of BRCA2, partial [Empidonax traillii]|uniref:partner and localizer of BRCA2 n=1 Tax=Empidonax traillii TaxID=164674 RepID=UPI000FFD6222
MEEPRAAGALSGADREKLREKLALLRREYSETVIRLRRARRAERARSHGRRERSPSGLQCSDPDCSKDNASPSADRGGLPQLQTKTCSDVDMEEATSVAFKHIAEFSTDDVSLQDSSRAESVQANQENLCCGTVRPFLEEKTSQTSRGMMKLRRRTKALESKERKSVRDGHVISTDETVKNQTASAEELQSPVFRHSTLSHTEEHPERASRPALAKGEGNSFAPCEFDAASGVVQEAFEDSVAAGEPELSPHVVRDSSDIGQLKCPWAMTIPGSREPCSQDRDSGLLDTRGDGGEESPSVIKQLDGKVLHEDQGELCGLLDLMSENEVLPEDRNNSVTKESKSHEGNESGADTLNPCPAGHALGSAQELSENRQLFPPKEVTAPEGALSSCTVVEGLLFPVEYYVRTTRRMSSCQRKVDLDAVILSQLGRSKKGQRSKCMQKDANSDQPSQERAEGDLESGVVPFPFLGAEKDPANSSSSEKSLPVSSSSSSSTSLGSISQKSIISTRQEQSRSQRNRKGRRRFACKAPVHPVSQELIESVDLITAREASALLPSESQSEKENCDANLGKSSSDESKLSDAAALESGETGVTEAAQPVGSDPPQGGSQVPGKCRKTALEQVQNPLQSSDAVSPGNETFARRMGDLEANSPVCQADKHPVASVRRRRGAGGVEQLPGISVPLRRSLRCSERHRALQGSAGGSSRERSCPTGSEGPAALNLPAADPNTRCSLFSFRSPQWLLPRLGVRDFHLPNEEFGVLKLEKLKSCPVNDLEDFVPGVSGDGVAPQDTPSAQMNPEEKSVRSNLVSPSKSGLPKLLHVESPASKKELSTHELLFTPMGTILAGAPTQPESQISSSVFPAVGATPGVLPSVHSEVFPCPPSVPTSQGTLPSCRGAAQVLGDGTHEDPATPLLLDSCGAEAATNGEERGTVLPLADERGTENKSDQAVALDEHQQSESEEQGSCRASPEQKNDGAEQLTPVLPDGPEEENLQLVSELKDSSGSCAVDVSTVWWEAAGCRELRVITASESSVSLWEPLAPNHWGKVCTWQLGEIPVIQIVPLPDTCNLVCVALGELEIGEIRFCIYLLLPLCPLTGCSLALLTTTFVVSEIIFLLMCYSLSCFSNWKRCKGFLKINYKDLFIHPRAGRL